jgi:hypothetical protein
MAREKYSKDYIIAFHEAAHAVVRISLGLSVTCVEISDGCTDRDGYMGVFDERGPVWDLPAIILGGLASIPAERLLRPSRTVLDLMLTHCRDDWEGAIEIVRHFSEDREPSKALDKHLRQAGKLVRKLAPVIHNVAAELERSRRLEYNEILVFVPDEIRHEGVRESVRRICGYTEQNPDSLIAQYEASVACS